MTSNTAGSNNIAFGLRTLEDNVNGNSNIAIGQSSLFNNISGSDNIVLGRNSGYSLSSGNNNIFIGYDSGRSLTNGSYNTIIGRASFFNTPSTSTSAGNDTSNSIVLADGVGNQRLFIHSNGYTGIGLGNAVIPQNRLELDGGLSGTSGLRFRNYTSSSSTVSPNGKVLTLNADGDVVLTTDQGGSGGGSNDNIYTTDGTLAGNRTVSMANNRLMFNTATNGAIYVGNTSNVNDNSNFPTTTGDYKLYVEGGILAEKVKVALRSTASWADYVFENDYKLMPLQEVETYIKKHKHLPGIVSAEDLVENGLDVAEMQAKQMEKIEELTLYVIKQNKEIEILKKQVKALLERQ